MHKSATKYNETLSKWCKNKHGASKIIDTFETYHSSPQPQPKAGWLRVVLPEDFGWSCRCRRSSVPTTVLVPFESHCHHGPLSLPWPPLRLSLLACCPFQDMTCCLPRSQTSCTSEVDLACKVRYDSMALWLQVGLVPYMWGVSVGWTCVDHGR
jgi:hypothetical protein